MPGRLTPGTFAQKKGKFVEKLINRLSLVSGYVSGSMIFAMMLLVTASVAARRVFGYPLVFGDEYSAYLMVFCVFLGAAYTLQQDQHIRVDILAIRFKPRVKWFFQWLTSCLTLVYTGVLTWQTTKLVFYYKRTGQTSSSVMETATWIPAVAVPVGLALLSLQNVACIVKEFRAFRNEKRQA